MEKYTPVNVITESDEFGNVLPIQILWSGKRSYKIQRILQVCQPEDKIIRYTILISNKQRQLYYNGSEWRVSAPSAI